MEVLLTQQRFRDRLVHFLGMEDLPSLVLAHPALYEPCLSAPSISTPDAFLRVRPRSVPCRHFLPALALDCLPALRHVEFVACSSPVTIFSPSPEADEYEDEDFTFADAELEAEADFAETPAAFELMCRRCVPRDISLPLPRLVVLAPCTIPRELRLSIDRLTFHKRPAAVLFHRHRFPSAYPLCRVNDWPALASANPAVFESLDAAESPGLDLSCADIAQSWLQVDTPTPLMQAVASATDPAAVQDLAERWGRCVCNGRSALMMAASAGNARLVASLAQVETGIVPFGSASALAHAAAVGSADCVSILVPFEAGLAQADGSTALMAAASHGHADCVALLRLHEASMTNLFGQTARDLAAANDRADCVALLQEEQGSSL
jgi:hypothetical protein